MSYVNPNIDHNLYNSMMPQLPVDLMARVGTYRQQMYDAGVAQFQQKVGSMLNMENNVSSELVKGMVNNYNKEANDVIKQYATLDFSRQDNVNLVDKVYEPLMNDKAFMMDYSATLSKQSQIQKALALRDSSKKEDRDQFNMTNFRRMLNDYEDLGTATTLEELTKATGKTRGAVYTPYEDYKKDILTLVSDKSFFVTEDTSPIGGGYMVSYKGTPYKSMAVLLESMLTDKQLGQMKIEADVRFHDEWKLSGVSKTAYLGVVQDAAIKSTESKIAEHEEQITSLDIKLASFGDDDKKLSPSRLAEKQKAQKDIKKHQSFAKQYSDILSEYTDDREKFKNGEVGEDVVYNSLENIASRAYMSKTINDMAIGLSQFTSTKYSKDETHFANLADQRARATHTLELNKFELEKIKYVENVRQFGLTYALDALKEGFSVDANGNLIKGVGGMDGDGAYVASASEAATTNVLTTVDDINSKVQVLDQENARNVALDNSNVLLRYATEHVNFDGINMSQDEKQSLANALLTIDPSMNMFAVKANINGMGLDPVTKANVLKVVTALTDPKFKSGRGFDNSAKWGDVTGKINSYATSADASDELKNLHMTGKINKIENGLALQTHITMMKSSVKAFNAKQGWDLLKYNPETMKIEYLYNDKPNAEYASGLVFEKFEDFLKTPEGIKGSYQSTPGKGTSNSAIATSIVSSNVNNQIYQAFEGDLYSKDQTMANKSVDKISIYDSDVNDYVNDLARRALKGVGSNQIIIGKNKNKQNSVDKFEDFGHFHNIKLNRTYLEQIAGLTNFDGDTNTNYSGKYSREDVSKIIDFIIQKGITIPTDKEKPKFNTLREATSNGTSVPITSEHGKVKFNIVTNGDRYNVSIKMPENYIQFPKNSKFTYDANTGTLDGTEHVSNTLDVPMYHNDKNPVQVSSFIQQADNIEELNNFVQSPVFKEQVAKDIRSGKIALANNNENSLYLLTSDYIQNLFNISRK